VFLGLSGNGSLHNSAKCIKVIERRAKNCVSYTPKAISRVPGKKRVQALPFRSLRHCLRKIEHSLYNYTSWSPEMIVEPMRSPE